MQENKVKIIFLPNPFNDSNAEVMYATYVPDKTVAQYVARFTMGYELTEFEASCNGNSVPQDMSTTVPFPRSVIVLSPHVGKGGGGKNILRTIASIALSVYAGNVAGGLWGPGAGGAGLGASFASGGFMAGLAAVGIMAIGGLIINHFFPPNIAAYSDSDHKTTYGWGTGTPMVGQGMPLDVTYGTYRTQGVLLSQHVESIGDTQYLNLVMTGGEGELDSITDIEIADNPLNYYSDVTLETRLGTNDQKPLSSYFANTYADQQLNYELNDATSEWASQRTDGNCGEGLEIVLSFPGGLCYVNDNGGYSSASVTVAAQYKLATEVEWKNWDTWTITDSTASSFSKTYPLSNLPVGQYDVRCRCTYKSGKGTRYSTRVYWAQLTQVVKTNFARPNRSIVAVRIKATNQLSGSLPRISWLQTRSKVYVWNPELNAYKALPATNPAWAAYDIRHRCKYLMNINTKQKEYVVFGSPARRMDYYAYKRWADYCTEQNLTFNYIYHSSYSLWDACKLPEIVGRGKTFRKGTNHTCTCDAPSAPVQLFTVGNIGSGGFKISYLPKKDRANAIELTFKNKAKNYDSDTITVFGDNYNVQNANPAQITVDGIVDYEAAVLYAKYLLRLNKYLLRTITFPVDIDAIACQLGQVIYVQHDVLVQDDLEEIALGGRIVSATLDTVTLDTPIKMIAGKTYAIIIRLKDDTLVQREVGFVDGETTVLTLKTPFTVAPELYDVYAFGQTEKVVRRYRIMSLTRDGDLRRKISAIEYFDEIYDDDGVIPVRYNTPPATIGLKEVTNINISQEYYVQKDGTVVSNVNCSYDLPAGRYIREVSVYYSLDDGVTWEYSGYSKSNTYTHTNALVGKNYRFKFVCVGPMGEAGEGAQYLDAVYITGKDEPPPNVTGLTVTIDPSDRTKAVLRWNAVDIVDLKGYLVTYEGNTYRPSGNSQAVVSTNSAQTMASVVAIDNSGNQSTTPATINVPTVINPSNITNFSVAREITDRSVLILSWDAVSDTDLAQYEIRKGSADWQSAGFVQRTKSNRLAYRAPASGYYRLWIKAINASGRYSETPVSASMQVVCEPDAPTALTTTQNYRNRKQVFLSWTAPTGLDIAGYDVLRGGVLVGRTTDTFYTDAVSVSGAYEYKVRAKSAGGFYSAYVATSNPVVIEPLDVTGFRATQLIENRSKVRLIWDANNTGDLSHYIIKEGISWDAGTVIATHAIGTYYDANIADERVYTWWIKAVSIDGIQSLNPASFTSTFSMRPSAPTNINVVADNNDRTTAVISWAGIPDSDLLEYELRYGGTTWADATTIVASTKETSVTWNPPESNSYTIRLKARNVAKFESDEKTTTYTAYIEPSNVSNFVASQNGDNILLVWRKVADVDVVGYEIRDGGTFENGQLIATGVTGSQYQFGVDSEITHKYWIKAINRAGKYSKDAVASSVTVANLTPKNIILSNDEIALQSGTSVNTVFGQSMFTFATFVGKFSDYTTTKFSDVGGATVLKLALNGASYYPSGTYTSTVKDLGQIITANISCEFQPSILFSAGTSATLEYRISQNNVIWDSWKPFIPIVATFRYLQIRVILATTDTSATPEVNRLVLKIDVPDTDRYGTSTIPSGGATIQFGYSYWTMPFVSAVAIGAGLRAEVIAITKIGFTVKVVNALTGVDTGGSFTWHSKGY